MEERVVGGRGNITNRKRNTKEKTDDVNGSKEDIGKRKYDKTKKKHQKKG